jgi:hypothetical protein
MITLLPAQADFLGGALGFFFTVALLSYLIGDNPLYRVALHLFIGVSVGYVTLVVIYQAILPRVVAPLQSGGVPAIVLALIPVLLFLFLLLRIGERTAFLSKITIAFMLGVGTAVALGGAVIGTLIPQIRSTSLAGDTLGLISGLIVVVGTIATLIYFQFWLRGRSASGDAQRAALMRIAGQIGQGFLMLTFGVIYGGMILSGIVILSERLMALYGWALNLLP